MSTLYIVATPIGNLSDITLRALEVLKGVDLILAEDTRVTKKLLDRYQIKNPLLSYHQHSKLQKLDQVLEFLKQGKNLALVSDAGTPGIADPGNELIEYLLLKLPDLKIIPIPGPSALDAAASVCGFPMGKFLFLGFPPAKKKRQKFFKEVLDSKYPVIFFESCHRILRTLEELKELSSLQKELSSLRVVVCRELTKMFEKTYRGSISQVLEEIRQNPVKGEFVVIFGGKKEK